MDQTTDLISGVPKKVSAAIRLLDVAGPLFADRPFDVVSTREIAQAASVNLSAISYHFKNKEGLYEAIFQKIIEDLAPIRDAMSILVASRCEVIRDCQSAQRELVKTFIYGLIDAITHDNNPKWRMCLIMRELHSRGPCFDLVTKGHINVMHDIVGKFVAVIIGKAEADDAVKLMSQALIGICLHSALNEEFMCQRMGWNRYGPDEIQILKVATSQQIFAMLGIAETTKA